MALDQYQTKRRFDQTPEPRGQARDTGQQRFVVQEHHATALHFDFRLEMGGVLVSWAVPKGPSLDPRQRHLAVRVEDHPVEYIDFEGTIAEGNYGAGQVAVWDSGTYELLEGNDPQAQLDAGKLTFRLHGRKLRGDFALIKMGGRAKEQWLLIKSRDQYARPGWELVNVLDTGAEAPAARRGARKGSAAKKKAAMSKGARPAAARTAAPARRRSAADGKQAVTPGPIPGAEAAPLPEHVAPMLATLVNAPPEGDWLFETKWDGVRALAYLDGGALRLMSRNDKELGFRYPELAGLPGWVRARQAILDGEIVFLEEDGRSNFQRLQARIGLQDPAEIRRLTAGHPITYVVFDLLYLDGFDLRPAALADRKALLRERAQLGPALAYSEHMVGEGERAFAEARAAGQEGIVAKRPESPYYEGRAGAWLKLKAVHQQEVVIGGYTQPRQTRQYLGALVVGVYDGGRLRYVGHVGGGFDRNSLEEVYNELQPLITPRSPFAQEPPTNEPVHWVRPERVAEVKFAGWTDDQKMRQPIFLGMRDDKEPREVIFERPRAVEEDAPAARRTPRAAKTSAQGSTRTRANGHSPRRATSNKSSTRAAKPPTAARALTQPGPSGDLDVRVGSEVVSLTHLDRVYWPDAGITKGDLLRYYWQVRAPLLLALKDRPLILKRYPNGIDQKPFFQHDVDVKSLPPFVDTFAAESETGRALHYAVCQNAATLLYLVNLGTIAMNPWSSRVGAIDRPDWMVFDLDPGQVAFRTVCDAALAVKDVLDRLGLASHAKTSGSRGIHLYVPLKPVHTYQQVAELAESVARQVAAERSDLATVERSKASRPAGKVYVDFLQNAHGKSVACAYSAREHPGATVSAPLTWREVQSCPDLSEFNIHTMPQRLTKRGDLFQAVRGGRQTLKGALEKVR